MGYLNGQRAYLSGPIQHGNNDLDWRAEPTRVMTEQLGINVFDPFADPKQQWVPTLTKAMAEDDDETIERIAKDFVSKDLSMVTHSDMLVAYLPYKVPTYGTTHEIVWANADKKPTLLVCPEGRSKIPLWFRGFIKRPFLFGSWSSLYEYLHEVDAGKHMNNRRWALIYGLL